MKIKELIIKKIDNPQSRTRIATDLGVGEQAVAVQVRNNANNGRLTKMDALQAISKETGESIEQILEDAIPEEVQNGLDG